MCRWWSQLWLETPAPGVSVRMDLWTAPRWTPHVTVPCSRVLNTREWGRRESVATCAKVSITSHFKTAINLGFNHLINSKLPAVHAINTDLQRLLECIFILDLDYCSRGHQCHADADCKNGIFNYSCHCHQGFQVIISREQQEIFLKLREIFFKVLKYFHTPIIRSSGRSCENSNFNIVIIW